MQNHPALRDLKVMSDLKLVIGNKNISSWSFRPWILLTQFGIPFEEISLKLFTPEYAAIIDKYSPSKKVPVLNDGDLRIWDSLSIAEYLAEKYAEKGLWPKDRTARAKARSVTAEMHSGFTGLRSNLSMNFHGRKSDFSVPEDAKKDIDRIQTLWEECLSSYGGPFLFGQNFSIADAFYAPVVSRFITYGVKLGPKASEYVQTISNLPSYKSWGEGAKLEIN
ncbi:glutathione S-transferase, N-terminal domain protein [Leptospira licerasiae serovar Varillal str. VAR 010]|uniref:Glutathione S-transferase, N-terminal domain protein n=2 Tax=Leptospira licerasiae TaxID=447106 RepID=A0ABP2RAP6_9LEPT|nr:glutathione S-transferase, N-terminal domain protein [Leptospira licerasiae serovar Varillal str. VAR 010]EJZ40359.1 glutathione S-transferase, N-terminal domain protein [Leptospira licerasiae str. MMD4847]